MVRRVAGLIGFVVMCGLTIACGKSSSVAPSVSVTPDPPPTETVPAGSTKQYLVDPAGNQLPMWAEIVSLKPARGAGIFILPNVPTMPGSKLVNCDVACYAVTMRFGIDANSPYTAGGFNVAFNADGKFDINTMSFGQNDFACFVIVSRGEIATCQSNGGTQNGVTTYTLFHFLPQYLTVGVVFRGSTSFPMNYHQAS